jgi:hypothetical protein
VRRLCDDLRRCARRIGELQCARLVPERAFGKRQKRSINESTSDPASIATARGTNKALRPQTRPSLLTAAAAAVCQACCVVAGLGGGNPAPFPGRRTGPERLRTVRAKRLFFDCQRSPVEWLGVGVATLRVVERSQIV